MKLRFSLAPLMYCGKWFGVNFVVAGLRWPRRSRRLRNFGAEVAQPTQPHQNHKPVFAEYHYLEKKKKKIENREKKKREYKLITIVV